MYVDAYVRKERTCKFNAALNNHFHFGYYNVRKMSFWEIFQPFKFDGEEKDYAGTCRESFVLLSAIPAFSLITLIIVYILFHSNFLYHCPSF